MRARPEPADSTVRAQSKTAGSTVEATPESADSTVKAKSDTTGSTVKGTFVMKHSDAMSDVVFGSDDIDDKSETQLISFIMRLFGIEHHCLARNRCEAYGRPGITWCAGT